MKNLMYRKSYFLLLSFLLLLSANCFADESEYKIEILIFENKDVAGAGEEQWRELEESPSAINTVPVIGGEGSMIRVLQSSSLNLTQARNKMEGSGKYSILYHKGWSQRALPKEESTAAWIEIPGLLEGTINLHKKRFLHVTADLVFNSFEGSVRLNESRRLKSKELHYLDHPLFGMLVRVVKLEVN